MSMNYYDKFVAKLQEIFMMDHAELDFGIYRIMNQKRDEINRFLQVDLLPQVKQPCKAMVAIHSKPNSVWLRLSRCLRVWI